VAKVRPLVQIINFKQIKNILPIKKIQIFNFEISFIVSSKHLMPTLLFFKNHCQAQFKILTCISCADFPTKKFRFMLVYELLSLRHNARIKIKTFTHELLNITSSGSIFPAALWYESEIWDLFGVFFKNHFDLKRILTDYGFVGYPLRKDFPLNGFIELRYSAVKNRVVSQLVSFSQEFRIFNFTAPWKA
jgi:NADH dehydrogenase (ubiquinone) Fe-S protein 3